MHTYVTFFLSAYAKVRAFVAFFNYFKLVVLVFVLVKERILPKIIHKMAMKKNEYRYKRKVTAEIAVHPAESGWN